MKYYNVLVPFTGAASFNIEASTEEEAIDKAFAADFRITVDGSEEFEAQVDDFSIHRIVVDVGGFYGCLNEVDIMELKPCTKDT